MGNGLLLEREVLLMHPLCLCKSTAFVLTHALLLSFSSLDIKGVLCFFFFFGLKDWTFYLLKKKY